MCKETKQADFYKDTNGHKDAKTKNNRLKVWSLPTRNTYIEICSVRLFYKQVAAIE